MFSCISIVITVCGFGLSVQYEPVEAQPGWSPSPRAAQLMEFEELISDPRWQWDPDEARAVAHCESWLTPHVVRRNTNGTYDHGLFQINSVWEPAKPELWNDILDPATNVEVAHHIWLTGNRSWRFWRCQP